MASPINLVPAGIVRSPVKELRDDVFGGVIAKVELDATRFTPESLQGLTDFSHVEIIFVFHQLKDSEIVPGSRHPRNRADWPKVGIFAQRAKARPSRIGATVCRWSAWKG
jgi:tRNA (Thr-GGU) A37 N-methylase